MINQSFSAENFERIFNIENRKGNINKNILPPNYIDVIIKIKDKKKEITKHLRDYKEGKIDKEELNRLKDECNDSINNLKTEKESVLYDYLKKISKEVNLPKFKFNFQVEERYGKPIYILNTNVSQFYILKQLQYNIRKTFKVKQSDRYRVLKQVKSLLSDGFPKIVIRTDIESFYESIPQTRLMHLVLNNTLLTQRSKFFISSIIDEYEKLKDKKKEHPNCGIPRGAGVSAYLSELYMKDIDNHIKSIDNVTFYARYVDDIFIIITPQSTFSTINYKKIIEDTFSYYGLTMKEDKTEVIHILKNKIGMASLNYLGYSFLVDFGLNHCNLKIDLTKNKVDKYKKRIKAAFDDYNIKSKYDEKKARKLLFNRLRFLSANTKLLNSKEGIKVGIFYSNSLLDNSNLKSLSLINGYLKKMVYTNLKPFCKTSFNFNKLQQQILNQFDFCDGFTKKKFHNYKTEEFSEIMRVWKDEI